MTAFFVILAPSFKSGMKKCGLITACRNFPHEFTYFIEEQ